MVIRRLVVAFVMSFVLTAAILGGVALRPTPASATVAAVQAARPGCINCLAAPRPTPKVKVGRPITVSTGGGIYSCQLWYAYTTGEYSWECVVVTYPGLNWVPWLNLW